MTKTSAAEYAAILAPRRVSAVGAAMLAAALCALAPAAAEQPSDQQQAAKAAVEKIDALDMTVVEAWQKAPLTVRRALFQATKAEAYGAWQERPSNAFAPGEKLLTYAEPVGYVWKDLGEGVKSIAMTLDFTVKTPSGKVLGGQEGFQRVNFQSKSYNREFFLNLTMDLTGITPGDYVLVYTMHDLNGGKTASFEQPFKISGAPGWAATGTK